MRTKKGPKKSINQKWGPYGLLGKNRDNKENAKNFPKGITGLV